jgi:sugar phosphate isomerase/epimerase
MARRALRAAPARVGLSTASVYPEPTAVAFELAAALGYDGVEVMVWTDPVSQDPAALRALSERYSVPILAIHAPCLIITQRVWSPDGWVKLQKAQAAAEFLGAQTVVVHPPFRWQKDYSRDFRTGLAAMTNETEVAFAVENMFPLRVRGREVSAYQPTWNVSEPPAPVFGEPDEVPYGAYTLDLSHAAVSRSDTLAMVTAMGSRLRHVHIADGTGINKDEHLVPGRGSQPCAEVLERLSDSDFRGHVIVEVNTRRALTRDQRTADLAESLAFCRLHLVAPQSVPQP